MKLDLWKPWNKGALALLPSLDEELSQLFRAFDQPFALEAVSSPAMAADVSETADALRIALDLPGHDPKQVQIQVEGDTLTIRSERRHEKEQTASRFHRKERAYGVVARSFVLPGTVDASKAEARFEHGTLTVTLPKREEARPRSIEVKVVS